MFDLLDNTKVLLVFNDDIADELEFDFSKISKIIRKVQTNAKIWSIIRLI